MKYFLTAILFVLITTSAKAQTANGQVADSSVTIADSVVHPLDSNSLSILQDSLPASDSLTATDSISADSVVKPQITNTSDFSPSLGFTFNSSSQSEEDIESIQWLAGLDTRLSSESEKYQFVMAFQGKYGQIHRPHELPSKTQDNLMLSFTPSMTLIGSLGIRLFLEAAGETQFTKGEIDGVESNFLDPLFLYETVFLGRKTESSGDNYEISLTYGVGYAFQETFTRYFVLEQNRQFVIDESNPLQNVQSETNLESGYSALIDFRYRHQLTEALSFSTALKTVAMAKDKIEESIKNSRVGGTLSASINYSVLSLEYYNHLVYDRNISLRRKLEQSLVFGFKLSL